jgi:hypothetical protein
MYPQQGSLLGLNGLNIDEINIRPYPGRNQTGPTSSARFEFSG